VIRFTLVGDFYEARRKKERGGAQPGSLPSNLRLRSDNLNSTTEICRILDVSIGPERTQSEPKHPVCSHSTSTTCKGTMRAQSEISCI
jgi:hypothetical protein